MKNEKKPRLLTDENLYIICPKCKTKQSTINCEHCGNTLLSEGLPSYVYMNFLIMKLQETLELSKNIITIKYEYLNFSKEWIKKYYDDEYDKKVLFRNNEIIINPTIRHIAMFQNLLLENANNVVTKRKIELSYYDIVNRKYDFKKLQNDYIQFVCEVLKFMGENEDVSLKGFSLLVEEISQIFIEDYADNIPILLEQLKIGTQQTSRDYKSQINKINNQAIGNEMANLYASDSLLETSFANYFIVADLESKSDNLKQLFNNSLDDVAKEFIDKLVYNLKYAFFDFTNIATLSTILLEGKNTTEYSNNVMKKIWRSYYEEDFEPNISFEKFPYVRKYAIKEIEYLEKDDWESFLKINDTYNNVDFISNFLDERLELNIYNVFVIDGEFEMDKSINFLSFIYKIDVKELLEQKLDKIILEQLEKCKSMNFINKKIFKKQILRNVNKFKSYVSAQYILKIINIIKNN